MADVFISYSRKDTDFVHQLHEALAAVNRDTWVDWEDIPLTAEWLNEIYAGIESANACLFILSPDSVESKFCGMEIIHAVQHHERLIPVVRHDVDPQTVPQALATLNWIFIRASDDFDSAFHSLMQAMDTDLPWVRDHTRLLVRAREWEHNRRDSSFMLRGGDLKEAEMWLRQGGKKDPQPTSLHGEYITASRKAVAQRQRLTLGSVLLVLIVTIVLALWAWEQRNQAVSRELAASATAQLQVDPELSVLLAIQAAETAPTAQAENVLRQSLIASRLRATMRGHRDAVPNAVFSPDGKWVLTWGADHTARVWDAATGTARRLLGGDPGEIQNAAFSSDGKRIITANTDNTAQVWDWQAEAGQTLLTLPHTSPVESATFSPDDRLIVTTGSGKAWIWDTVAGKGPKALGKDEPEEPWIGSVAFSPDSSRIVTSSRDTAEIWDAITGRRIGSLEGHKDQVNSAAFSPDGKWIVTASRDFTARVWDAATRALIAELLGHEDQIWRAVFSPDSRLVVTTTHTVFTESGGGATALGDKTVRVWEAMTGKPLATLLGHPREVNSAAFSPNSQFVITASADRTARVWEAATGRSLTVLRGHTGAVNSAAFNPTGDLVVTASDDGTARVWDTMTGQEHTLPDIKEPMHIAALSPDGAKLLVAMSADSMARLFEIKSDKEPKALSVSRQARATLRAAEVISAAFNLDGTVLVTTHTDNTAQVWHAATGDPVATWSAPTAPDGIQSAALNADGHMVVITSGDVNTASGGDTAYVREVRTGKKLAELLFGAPVYSAAFSPEGRRIVTAGESNEAWLWTWQTTPVAEPKKLIGGHADRILSTAFNFDGTSIVTASRDATACVWDTATGREIVILRGHDDAVLQAIFSRDGKLVVTVGADRTVRLWDVVTGKELAVMGGYSQDILSAALRSDCQWLLTVSGGVIRSYKHAVCGAVKDLLVIARTRVTREFMPAEREKYLHERRRK